MGFLDKARAYSTEKMIGEITSLLPRFNNKNVIRMLSIGEKLTRDEEYRNNARRLRELFEQGHPASILIKDVINRLSPTCGEKLIRNLFINAFLVGIDKRKHIAAERGFQPPQFLVISPTMRCNLGCPGCYAGRYDQEEGLPFELIDRILTESKELGMYFNTMSGGEVFTRKDMYDIWKKHDDMYFQLYTNGTMITEKAADRMAELGNVAPMCSLEGFEKETDERRGKGTFKRVLRAMDLMRERGMVFGASITETRSNMETIASYEFIDMLLDKGAMVIWYFQYIPIGRCPSMDVMPTPEQRDRLRRWIKEVRESRPIFIGDFWNDGPHVKGCIAGGREYLHINSKGDVEPCVFCHFAVDNIRDKSLEEAINSPFMRSIRAEQPYRENLLTPCMIIDSPDVLRRIVRANNARPTCDGAEGIITNLATDLDEYAIAYRKYADPAWEKEYMGEDKRRAAV